MSQKNIWTAYGNTIYYSLAGTALSMFLTILGSYSLSKRRLRGRKLIMLFVLITMWFGAGMMPNFLNFKNLGLLDSRLGIIATFAVDGNVRNIYSQSPASGWAWGISKDCKDPVAAIKLMDFWLSYEGAVLMTYGVEGKSYTLKDGKPQYTDEAYAFGGGIPNYMRSLGAVGFIEGIADVDLSQKTEVAQQAYLMYFPSGCLVAPFPVLSLNEEEEAIYSEISGPVETLWREYEQQVLYGEKDVDASWAGYLAEMKALGLQQLLDAQNSAYGRYSAAFN